MPKSEYYKKAHVRYADHLTSEESELGKITKARWMHMILGLHQMPKNTKRADFHESVFQIFSKGFRFLLASQRALKNYADLS